MKGGEFKTTKALGLLLTVPGLIEGWANFGDKDNVDKMKQIVESEDRQARHGWPARHRDGPVRGPKSIETLVEYLKAKELVPKDW